MNWPFLRDVFLFFGGMAGVLHETLIASADRPTLLILFAAMMGLPAFLQQEQAPSFKTNERPKPPKRRRHLEWVYENETNSNSDSTSGNGEGEPKDA